MRIAFVTPEYVTESNFDGGLANYLYRVSLSLIKLGHSPIIVVASDKNETLLHNGIEINRVFINNKHILLRMLKRLTGNKIDSTLIWLFQSWSLNRVLKKIHQKNAIDIIQYASYTATGYFRMKKIPSVVRLSSYQPLWREAYGNLNPSIDELKMEDLERSSFKKADGIFGPSYIIAKEVERVIGKKVTIIEPPFLLETRDLNENIYDEYLKGKQYLLFFGSLGLLKGVGNIAEIIYELLDKNRELYFVLVGKDFGMAEVIKKNAQEHRSRILYFNKMNHNKLYPIIEHAFAVVLPSRIDNFPNTCLEAMAHKKVVIGTKGTSFEQLINDGTNGFLCEKDNSTDLLQTIERVLALSTNELDEIGRKANERIQKLNPGIVVKDLIDYYTKVIEGKG
jgi:glycosyltransferase involved in cell wall biosynthesis